MTQRLVYVTEIVEHAVPGLKTMYHSVPECYRTEFMELLASRKTTGFARSESELGYWFRWCVREHQDFNRDLMVRCGTKRDRIH